MTEMTTATINLRYPDGPKPVVVVAQKTATPGVVITPEIGYGERFTGFWHLTHEQSGLAFPVGDFTGVDLATAERVGDALHRVPVNWAGTQDEIQNAVRDNPEVSAKLREVVHNAKYPPVDADAGTPGPGEYPKTADQVTAATMAASYVHTALGTYALHWKLLTASHRDKPAKAVYVASVAAMLAEYGLAHVLREFAKVDEAAATAAARDLWEAFDAGDSIGEVLSDWGREYGIPTPNEDEVTAELVERRGLTFPPPADYDTVLNWGLPYGDGNIRTLREEIAKVATQGQRRYSDITVQVLNTTHHPELGPLIDDKLRREHQVSLGASFFGWSLVALLGWLAKEHPTLARRAAGMVDDIGNNGGNEFCEDVDIPDPDTGAAGLASAPADNG